MGTCPWVVCLFDVRLRQLVLTRVRHGDMGHVTPCALLAFAIGLHVLLTCCGGGCVRTRVRHGDPAYVTFCMLWSSALVNFVFRVAAAGSWGLTCVRRGDMGYVRFCHLWAFAFGQRAYY